MRNNSSRRRFKKASTAATAATALPGAAPTAEASIYTHLGVRP